jgi:hypothetical protein
MSVGLASVLVTVGTVYGGPLVARAFVWGLRLVVDGLLWMALSLSTGADLWTIAGAAGQGIATSLATPLAIGGTGALLLLGALAVFGLRRLFESWKESLR